MKKILLIEDNREIRENTEEILLLYNYKVETAENGSVGLSKVYEFFPDLIICDIMMPEMNGYEVLTAIKKDSKVSSIPFIYFTAKSESMDLDKGMKLGASAYLIKPFDDEELLQTINFVLAK